MRILIIAPGSRGDVQPYLALGKGLLDAGHPVRFVSHNNFKSLANASGVEFWPVESDIQGIVETDEMRQRIEGGNFLSMMAQMAKEAQREAICFTEVGLTAAHGMDLVLTGMGGMFIGLAIAEKTGLPLLQAYVVPFTPTHDFPSVLSPRLPTIFNRLSHEMTRQLMWQGFRQADTLARKMVLGLPAAPLFGPYNSRSTLDMSILYGFSPTVITPPSDWNANIHITGYWFSEDALTWEPPTALVEFIQSGSPPVYIGFGSLSSRDPEKTASLIIHALEMIDQRAIILRGWSGLHKTRIPESIMMIDSVPHSWLFPRVSAVVHHGGASTTAAGLRAGVPSVIVPFFGDQPFWGQLVADLGVGSKPIPRRKLTSGRLATAIQEALTNEDIRQRAANLGEKIRKEDGIAASVEIIAQLERRISSDHASI